MPQEIISPLVEWGILGIFLLIVMGVVAKLWNDGRARDAEIRSLNEARIAELKAVIPVTTRAHENNDMVANAMADARRAEAAVVAAITALSAKIDKLPRDIAREIREEGRRI